MDHPGCLDPLLPQDAHLDYILAAAHLFAQAHKVPPCSDRAAAQTILRSVVLLPFAPQEGLQISLAEEQEEAQAPAGEAPCARGFPRACPQVQPGGGGAAALLVPAPAPGRTRTERVGTVSCPAIVPRCRGPTPGVSVPPDCRRLAELTQDLVQQRKELVGGEEAQVPLMEPIHFEKVPGAGQAALLSLGVGGR